MTRTVRVDHVTVVVPAHNERADLPDCLHGLREASGGLDVPVRIVVVLDACSDGSAEVVGPGIETVVVDLHNVGAARRAGFAAVPVRRHEWFATTDADSRVPPNWLSSQLAHASAGAELVPGTVVVDDWSQWSPAVRRRYLAAYGSSKRHVHGASLGFSAELYGAVSGFASLESGEDVDLIHRMIGRGAQVVWSTDAPVRTSARARGRAPAGFASHLASLR
ncbi:glycosyltransferase [Rhodococcus triatomae]|uniref:4,4'-diaponeurosporenoate glycosyltransferase n=1 Tax=Rhodococcus triatomae TaxID=300028 RepID=A0A1G8B5N9_9NOCA|nr:glycosyltransferase [Rhodococcus triatomae]QNG17573.1 glycosyltransferase [Rhodococcus triatomae]QNG22759.1 glycosyltransferase [Rhodococcus triatomae]SDH28507.1 Glycosyl transferase family 2 [Rhodococcus triatomae]